MKRNGTKQAIVDRLPQSWESILRKNRKLRKFQNLVYDGMFTKGDRNGFNASKNCKMIQDLYDHVDFISIIRICNHYKNAFLYLTPSSRKSLDEWYQIQEQIKEYEDACR